LTTQINGQDTSVVLNGLRFHYRAWGDDDAPAVVLLHGLRGHAHTWDRVAPVLAQRFRVLALDQRGRGESDWAPDYSLGAMAEDLVAFTKSLNLGRFMLLGHSLGGRTAFIYLQRYAPSVERLVLEDIGPGIEADGDERIQTGIEAAVRQRFATPEDAVRAALKAGLGDAGEDVRRDTLANLVQQDSQWRWRFDAAGLAAARRSQRSSGEQERFGATLAECWAAVRQIRCPTLLVRGANSDILGVGEAKQMVDTIPGCALVEVASSGHSVHIDNAVDYLAAVQPFLAATSLRRAV
jgi:esterase